MLTCITAQFTLALLCDMPVEVLCGSYFHPAADFCTTSAALRYACVAVTPDFSQEFLESHMFPSPYKIGTGFTAKPLFPDRTDIFQCVIV